MTPKARATICYYGGIPTILLAIFLANLVSAEQGFVSITLLVITIIGFITLAGYSIAISKCPHCARHMNLAGPSAHCPHCGNWIPFKKGQLAPTTDLNQDESVEVESESKDNRKNEDVTPNR